MSSPVCHFKPRFPVLSHFVLWPFLDSSSPHPQPSWTVRHIHLSHQSSLDVVFPAVIGVWFLFCFWMQVLVFVYMERHIFGFVPISLSDPDHTAMVIHPFHSSAGVPTGKEFSSYMAGLDMLPSLPSAELSHCSTLKGLKWEIRTGVRMGKVHLSASASAENRCIISSVAVHSASYIWFNLSMKEVILMAAVGSDFPSPQCMAEIPCLALNKLGIKSTSASQSPSRAHEHASQQLSPHRGGSYFFLNSTQLRNQHLPWIPREQ